MSLLSFRLNAANFYKFPDSQGIVFTSLVAVNDSNVLVVGFTADSVNRGIIFLADKNGDTLWSKAYADSLPVHFRSVALNHDSSRIVVVGDLEDTSGFEIGLILELDLSGNIQWQKRYPINASNIRFKELSFINSTSFAVSVQENDYGYLLICDSSGNSYRRFTGASFSDVAAPIVSLDGSLFISAVIYNSFDNSSTNIGLKTDTSFSILYWSNIYNGFTNNSWGTAGKKGMAMSDGGFLFTNSCETIFSMRCSVYRVDSTGHALWSIEGGPYIAKYSNGDFLFSNNNNFYTTAPYIRMDSAALSFTNFSDIGSSGCAGLVSLENKILGINTGSFFGFDSVGCQMTFLNNDIDTNYNYPVDPYTISMSGSYYSFPSSPALLSSLAGIGLDDDCTSLNVEEDSRYSLTVFPNPNLGIFKISFGDAVFPETTLRIIDLTGRIVFSKALYNSGNPVQDFDLTFMPKGIYVIEVTGNEFYSIKLVIE